MRKTPPLKNKGPQFYQKITILLGKATKCLLFCLRNHKLLIVHYFIKKVQYFVEKVHNFVQKSHAVGVSGYEPVVTGLTVKMYSW